MASKHTHKWVAQMGPGPSHGCEECGASKHMGNPFKSKALSKRTKDGLKRHGLTEKHLKSFRDA